MSIACLRVSGDASIWCLSDRFRVVATGYVDELIVSSMMYACLNEIVFYLRNVDLFVSFERRENGGELQM